MKKAIFSLEGSSSSLDKKNDEDKEEYHEEEEDAAGQKTKLLPNQGFDDFFGRKWTYNILKYMFSLKTKSAIQTYIGSVPQLSVNDTSSREFDDEVTLDVNVNVEGKIQYEVKDLFCELMEFQWIKGEDQKEWVETSRWVKFEETVEMGGRRWSKPRVATLSYHHIKQMQKYLDDGLVLLDLDGANIFEVAEMLIYRLTRAQVHGLASDRLAEIFLAKHHHLHETKARSRSSSYTLLQRKTNKQNATEDGVSGSPETRSRHMSNESNELRDIAEEDYTINEDAFEGNDFKPNVGFMRKLPVDAEACNILVGHVDDSVVDEPLFVFSRLSTAANLGDLTEVPVNTRFICMFLVPEKDKAIDCREIGRTVGTLMADEIFREIAYKAESKHDLLTGINEFLDNVTCMPPSEWDPSIRVDPPASIPSQTRRRKQVVKITGHVPTEYEPDHECEDQYLEHQDPTLRRTGRLFGGLVNDVKRRAKWYLSDFRDGVHVQCVGSFLFLYFACITSNVTFGGILGKVTDLHMANMENLLGGAICGVSFALFGGQPLTILGSTGPMLVFEKVSYTFCKENDIDYLPFRFWIGMWTSFILILAVAFDLSSLVRFITKFTEESFALLISIIFIYEAFEKMYKITHFQPEVDSLPNKTVPNNITMKNNCSLQNSSDASCLEMNSTLNSTALPMFDPNSLTSETEVDHEVFFFSVLLFFGTFYMAWTLKKFKNSGYFPTKVRQYVSDFAVAIAIASMIGLDYGLGISTPKLTVPTEFKPTYPNRGWLINPMGRNAWWSIFAAAVPAILATILIFMDQQITSVIINRKENKLKKGAAYHLDLLVVACQIALCSTMGLPWFVAATVRSMNHVNSLKVESETCAPGEKPTFLGVREQRLTALLIFALMGCSVLLRSFLKFVPMPVLYGVFLYLGVSALQGKEAVQRLLLVFQPQKYQPDYMYLRHVKTKRVHLFTSIQVLCLLLLWVVKQVKAISIGFPLMVMAMAIIRKFLEYIFNQRELFWLDDLLPGVKSNKKKDDDKGARKGILKVKKEEREMMVIDGKDGPV